MYYDNRIEEDYRENQCCELLRILIKNAFIYTDENFEILLGELEKIEWWIVFINETYIAVHHREFHNDTG